MFPVQEAAGEEVDETEPVAGAKRGKKAATNKEPAKKPRTTKVRFDKEDSPTSRLGEKDRHHTCELDRSGGFCTSAWHRALYEWNPGWKSTQNRSGYTQQPPLFLRNCLR